MASSLLKEMVKKECLNQSQTDNDGSSVVTQTTGQVPKRVDASGMFLYLKLFVIIYCRLVLLFSISHYFVEL